MSRSITVFLLAFGCSWYSPDWGLGLRSAARPSLLVRYGCLVLCFSEPGTRPPRDSKQGPTEVGVSASEPNLIASERGTSGQR